MSVISSRSLITAPIRAYGNFATDVLSRTASRIETRQNRVTRISRAYQTSPSRTTPQSSSAAMSYTVSDRNRIGKAHVALFRNWAEHGEWVRIAMNIRIDQLTQAEWDIVPLDMERPYDKGVAREIRDRLMHPNGKDVSWGEFIQPVAEDILALDAGCMEKTRTYGGDLDDIYYVDGGQMRVSKVWDGSDQDAPRYFWYPDGSQEKARFKNRDMIYMMMNPATYRVVGLSPLETLKYVIDAELSGQQYNIRMVKGAAPDGLLDLGEGARPDQVEAFRSYWDAEIAGRGSIAFLGGTRGAAWIPFKNNNREMQFQEWQNYLVRKTAGVFRLHAQDLLLESTNRAVAEVAQEQTEDRGFRPFLSRFQDYMTAEYVWDDAWGGSQNNLAFRFLRLNLKESQQKAQINKTSVGVSYKSPNEARQEEGRRPIGDPNDEANPFNWPMEQTAVGAVSLRDVPTAREALAKGSEGPTSKEGDDGAQEGKPPAKRYDIDDDEPDDEHGGERIPDGNDH